MVTVMLLSGCSQPAKQETGSETPLQVAFVYNGPIGDLGWIYAHEEGRKYLQEKMPDIETTYIEDVAEGPEGERVIRDFAIKGYDLIFTTTHGFGDATHVVAKEFPDTYFEHCAGYDIAANVSTYFARMYQARFLTGVVAGMMTESNTIGYVAAFPIPQVVRGINGFTLGVQAVNPDAKVHVVWTQSWFDPVLERGGGRKPCQYWGRCYCLNTENSAEAQKVAEEKGVWGIGYNTDMSNQGTNRHPKPSAVWNWGPYYEREVKAVLDGTWKSQRYWGGH